MESAYLPIQIAAGIILAHLILWMFRAFFYRSQKADDYGASRVVAGFFLAIIGLMMIAALVGAGESFFASL